MKAESNEMLQLTANFIQNTDVNVFLTGKAGTGKTTFLHKLADYTHKRFVVVAPTGVAAINAGGVTIHSFFQLPFGPQIPAAALQSVESKEAFRPSAHQRLRREKINIIRSLDLLVIDEISMVRADLLDAVDTVLRRYKDPKLPFGGTQLLLIGDLWQLAPIAKEEEWKLLSKYYDSVYFFSSHALQQSEFVSIMLEKVYRQTDEKFISLLNNLRDGAFDGTTLDELNTRYQPELNEKMPEGYIILTTHNRQADEINEKRLRALPASSAFFDAEINGDFPDYLYPTAAQLELKVGAQLMFVKNDPSPAKAFYNGKIGELIDIDEDDETLSILCEGEDEPIVVGRLEWHNTSYSLNAESKEIEEKIMGAFVQFPVKAAWAITIHKSQGLSFDKAIIDAQSAFAYGQVYVALSRCRSFEGLRLKTPLVPSAVKINSTVNTFVRQIEQNLPDKNYYETARHAYQLKQLISVFDFEALARILKAIIRLSKENNTDAENVLTSKLIQYEAAMHEQLSGVAEKFIAQLSRLAQHTINLEEDNHIQDRLKRAAAYFMPLLNKFDADFDFDLDTDNKAAAKSFKELIKSFLLALNVKTVCMHALQNGFVLSTLLHARAKAMIDEPARKKTKKSKARKEHAALDTILRQWRSNLAEELGLEAYNIITVKSIQDIVRQMPTTAAELKKTKGFGRVRYNKYGKIILELIHKFIEEDAVVSEEKQAPEEPKEPPKSSREKSLEMFLQGMSFQEIAASRELTLSTVEGHFSVFIADGTIAIEQLMSKEKLEWIMEYFLETEDLRLGPAKDVLGDEISFSELRWVINHLKFLGKIEKSDNTLQFK